MTNIFRSEMNPTFTWTVAVNVAVKIESIRHLFHKYITTESINCICPAPRTYSN